MRVATINILNFEHDWQRRLPLLRTAARRLDADVLALQEVVFPMDQDLLVGGREDVTTVRGWDEQPELGNSLVVRGAFETGDVTRRGLTRGCSAVKADLRGPGGISLSVTTTHLYWPEKARRRRARQGERILRLVDGGMATDGQVILGDFNADPDEPVCQSLIGAGFRSAYAIANGSEPDVTYPTPLLTGKDRPKRLRCVDYIWVRGALRVVDAGLAFDRPSSADPTLYPSDHLGLYADLTPG